MASKPPEWGKDKSREMVLCFYCPANAKPMRKDNLKSHFELKHPDKAQKFKHQTMFLPVQVKMKNVKL